MPAWMRMMLPPRRMTPPMGGQGGVPTGPGIPSGVSTPSDPDFYEGAGLPQLNYAQLDNNVIMPHSVFGSSRIARGMDNALLSLATMKPSQTLGEGISNVASNLIGLEPEREQINLSRQLSPYMAMQPLLQQKMDMARMKVENAMADYYSGRGDYYANGGRQPVAPIKQLDDGTYVRVNPDNTTSPLTDTNGNPVSGPSKGSSGTAIERLVHGLSDARVAAGGQPFSAQEFADQYQRIAGSITGAQTTGRNEASPKFTEIEANKNKALAKAEQDAQGEVAKLKPPSNPLDPEYMTAMQNPNAWLQQKKNAIYSRLNQTKQQIQSDYESNINQENQRLGRGNGFAPVPQGGPVDIPQPIVPPAGPGYAPAQQPQAQPINIGGIPATAVGVTPQQVAQAIVPPGPQAKAAPSAPAPKASPTARSGRPKVSIAPDGTIHVE